MKRTIFFTLAVIAIFQAFVAQAGQLPGYYAQAESQPGSLYPEVDFTDYYIADALPSRPPQVENSPTPEPSAPVSPQPSLPDTPELEVDVAPTAPSLSMVEDRLEKAVQVKCPLRKLGRPVRVVTGCALACVCLGYYLARMIG